MDDDGVIVHIAAVYASFTNMCTQVEHKQDDGQEGQNKKPAKPAWKVVRVYGVRWHGHHHHHHKSLTPTTLSQPTPPTVVDAAPLKEPAWPTLGDAKEVVPKKKRNAAPAVPPPAPAPEPERPRGKDGARGRSSRPPRERRERGERPPHSDKGSASVHPTHAEDAAPPAARDGSPGAGRQGDTPATTHEQQPARSGRSGQGGARGGSGSGGGRGSRSGRGPRGGMQQHMAAMYGMPPGAFNGGAMPRGQYAYAAPPAAFGYYQPVIYGPPLMAAYSAEPMTLADAICRQIEYYFSVQNLCKDVFLRSKMNEEGWIPLRVIAAFNRVRSLTNDLQAVYDAVANSAVVELKGAVPNTLLRTKVYFGGGCMHIHTHISQIQTHAHPHTHTYRPTPCSGCCQKQNVTPPPTTHQPPPQLPPPPPPTPDPHHDQPHLLKKMCLPWTRMSSIMNLLPTQQTPCPP